MPLKMFEEMVNDPYYRENLEEKKKKMQPIKVVVVGVGGAGVNTIKRLATMGVKHATLVAINTDIQHLAQLEVELDTLREQNPEVNQVIMLPIGEETTEGKGAGGDPAIAAKAAYESAKDIERVLADADLVFITCGEGGGTGTGAAPVVAKIAKEITLKRRGEGKEALVVSIVTFPFSHEGRVKKAMMGIKALAQYSDTVLVIENDKLVEVAGNLPVELAFRAADELIATIIKNLTETINEPSVVNIDFNDVSVVMKMGGIALIGVGESDSKSNRAVESIHSALTNRMMDVEIKEAKGALVHFTIGDDISLAELNMAIHELRKYLNPEAEIFFGARIDPKLKGMIRAMVIISGVENPYVQDDELGDFRNADDKIEKYFSLRKKEDIEKYNPLINFDEL